MEGLLRSRVSRVARIVTGGLVAAGLMVGSATVALASDGIEVPDSGALQVGRGGAWVARAEDPLAAYMNPAAMSFQASGVHVGVHLMFQSSCFSRVDEQGNPISPGNNIPGPGAESGPDPDTCATSIFPNPQLAAVFRITDRFALGVAAVGPHAVGNVSWPESIDFTLANNARTQPAPNRYLLVSKSSVLFYPTISASFALIPDELSIGAGFVWGIANAEFSTFTESTSSTRKDDFTRDVKATLSASDFFIPGFLVGLDWRAGKRVDFGAWFRWSDDVHSEATHLKLESNYWLAGGTKNDSPCPSTDPSCNLTDEEEAGTFRIAIPMEAKLGVRYHHPLPASRRFPRWAAHGALVGKPGYVRDPMSEDLFDVELDFTWANNSAFDAVHISFKPGIDVKGTPGQVPVNGDIPHDWKDVLGVRWGGDLTIFPSFLAVRAGGFFESKMQRDELLNLDFDGGWKAGLSFGGTVRLGPADLHLAYQHVFFETLDNGGKGQVYALSGDATSGFRSLQPVNGGRLSQQLNELALGATFRY